MKIGIISDSHGRRAALDKAMNRLGRVDAVVHLGDLYTDAVYIENAFNVKTVFVRGNCDFSYGIDAHKEVEFDGKRFFLTHGHLYRVKWGLQHLIEATSKKQFDVVLFGHTHIPQILYEQQTVFMNPGSLAEPRGGKKPTIGLIEISKDRVIPHIINFEV